MATQESSDPRGSQTQDEAKFHQLESYPWDSDAEFQSGLQAILGSNPSPEQAEHLTLRARCFYFSRKNNTPIDFNAYQTWRIQHASSHFPLTNGTYSTTGQPPPSNMNRDIATSPPGTRHEPRTATDNTQPPAPYPTSFSQIVALITEGQSIPGIKEVPDTVLEGQASQPNTARRKKPWETGNALVGEEAGGMINAS